MPLISRRTSLTALATLTAAGFGRKQAIAAALKPFPLLGAGPAPTNLPDLRLLSGNGKIYGISDFAGQGIVLNCWATWCGPCVEEMPSLARLATQIQAAGIAVVPLSSDRGGKEVVENFYRTHEITGLPIWLDPDGDAVHALKLRGIPTTLIIDRQGRERDRLEGAVDWATPDSIAKIKSLVGV